MLGDAVTLLLQIAYLTAIAMLVEKLSVDQAKNEKWVCTAAVVRPSRWGGLVLTCSIPLHSSAVIATPASAEITGSLPLTPVMFTPKFLRWPHVHMSIHPHSPKPLGEGQMVASSWLPFLCLLCSMVSERVTCALSHLIPCLNRNN